MERAGFKNLAVIDVNKKAIEVFKRNFLRIKNVLQKDLTQFPPEELAELIGIDNVDVIVGGPPCQGFSHVRQVDGANSGRRLVDDPRRHLYKEFLKYVKFFHPKIFVLENVLGIKTAAGGHYFTRLQQEARAIGYRVHPQIERSYELGVPQKRIRQFIIGTRKDLPEYFNIELKPVSRAANRPTLGEAIGDLPPIDAGSGKEESAYDMNLRKAHIKKYGQYYLYKTLEVQKAKMLTAHRARPHIDRDLRDFERLKEGEHCAAAIKRGEEFEFPYDRENFKDRYTRQHRNNLCSTIVAHLSKDGLMFIHPTQNRSLTPREVARIQTFPDWFEFPVARTHQFRLIGNAVPPLVSESMGLALKSYLEKTMNKKFAIKFELEPLPSSEDEAIQSLLYLIKAVDNKTLRNITTDQFKRGWYSIGFLYPGLHPDSALDHGTEISNDTEDNLKIRNIEPRMISPYYVQSGWPVVLKPVAKDAYKRYLTGELKEEEYYCSEAVIAGMAHRSPVLEHEVFISRKHH